MRRRSVLALFAVIVALSLVGSPITMSDWSEPASFSTEQIEESEIDEQTPLLHYDKLPNSAQTAVQRAIESSDGYYIVYGQEDWPDRFFYSDYANPGQGMYAIVYEEQSYRLYTYAAGGFPFIYWLYELPFIIYGLILGWVGYRTSQGGFSTRTAALTTGPGIVFHLLGPEFDFPLLAPGQFTILGAVTTIIAGIGLLYISTRGTNGTDAG